MKKILALIMAAVICCFAVTGCAGKDGSSEDAAPETAAVDGITVVSGAIGKPADGVIAYCPSDSTGYFAVDGTLIAQSTINISVNPNGILNYDLSLITDSAMKIDAEIRVFKGGKQLSSYSEASLPLPAGNTVINSCVKTEENAPCTGEYSVQFYINGTLVAEDTGTV